MKNKYQKQFLNKTKFSILLFLLVLYNFGNAQNKKMQVSLNINLKVDTTKVRLYDLTSANENENIETVILKMKYGDSEILNPKDAKVLEESGCNIISVDIVYTDYQQKDVQDKLNKKRITELFFLNPDILNQSMTQWKYIEQLGYTTVDDAKKLFHGIVIKYIKVPPYKPMSLNAMFGDIKNKILPDTSLFRVFNRCIKFKEELICVDMTGSMTPYYFQVFVWLNLKNTKKPLNFSFFNDGDNTPDFLKKTGNVGGLYIFNSNSIDTITTQAYNCIINGDGGDSPENNIESILKGVKQFPNTKEIVMLVDNWSDMRDYSMLSDVKQPVKVIVCGTDLYGFKTPVNTQYLDLARKTRGSIHTIEEDIEDLADKKEGEEISIGGNKYIIRGGKFYKK